MKTNQNETKIENAVAVQTATANKTENAVAAKTATKTENAVAPTATVEKPKKATAAKKPTAAKPLTVDEIKKLAKSCGCTFAKCKNDASSYLILDGKSSVNIGKNQYRLYLTNADIDIIEPLAAQLTKSSIERDGNAVDKVRPHKIVVKSNGDLKTILTAIAVNNKIKL